MIFYIEDFLESERENIIFPLVVEPSEELVKKLSAKGCIKLLRQLRTTEYRENYSFTEYLKYVVRYGDTLPTAYSWRNVELLATIFTDLNAVGIYVARRLLGVYDTPVALERLGISYQSLVSQATNFWAARYGYFLLPLDEINRVINNYPMGMFVNEVLNNSFSVDLLTGKLSDGETTGTYRVSRPRGFVTNGLLFEHSNEINPAIIEHNTNVLNSSLARLRTMAQETEENEVQEVENEAIETEEGENETTESESVYSVSLIRNDKEKEFKTNSLEALKAFFSAFYFQSDEQYKFKIKTSDGGIIDKLNSIFENTEEVVYDRASGELKLINNNDFVQGISCTASQLEQIAEIN